jgi:hypothetical protein
VENAVTVESLVTKFDEADTLTLNARDWSEKARDYYDGNQYTAAEMAIYKERQQPPTVNNRIAPMVDFLLGIELRSRTDPKAYPRSLSDTAEQDAESATDALRYVADNNFFDSLASEIFENFLIEGPGGVSVEVEGKGKHREIVLRKMPFNRMFFDPYSVERQKQDCNYTGLISWMDLAEISDRWGLSEEQHEALRQASTRHAAPARAGSTFDDVPRWYNRDDRNRIMVVEMYFVSMGKWHHAIFVKDMFLVGPEVSGYKDDKGKPSNPHILACPKISRNGEHYGPVRNKLSIQDDINKRHSRSTDLINRRQTYAKEGMITDIPKFKREANSSGGHLEFPPGPGEFGKDYGFVPNESLGQMEHQMFLSAIQQIESLARAGIAADNETNMSGKALGKLQTSRNLEIQPLVEVHSMWKTRVYRAIWERIRQYWTEERWIRVTDDESNTRFVGLNRRTTMEDMAKKKNRGRVPPVLQGHPQLGAPVTGPNGEKPLENEVSKIDVDIFIEEVPDITSLQEDTFEKLVEMYQANPQGIPWEKVIKLSPLRTKMKEELTGTKEPSPEEQQAAQKKLALQEEMIEIEKQDKIGKVRKTGADTAKSVSEAQQTQIENAILERTPIVPTNLSI